MYTELALGLYPSQPVFSEAILRPVELVLSQEMGPFWRNASVVRGEADDAPRSVLPSLPEAVAVKAVVRGGLGSVRIVGTDDESAEVTLVSSRQALPFESNRISIEFIEGTSEIAVVAANKILRALAAGIPLHYACAYIREERVHKNIVRDKEGIRAVGVNYEVSLPGLYWLNFFGPNYVALMGAEKLASAPGQVEKIGNGYLVQRGAEPSQWKDLRELEAGLLGHLGEQYFFSKDDPERKTVAPDFA